MAGGRGDRASVWSFLNGPVFVVALGAGLLVTYMTVPPPKIVIKFPTPYNAGKIVYEGSPEDPDGDGKWTPPKKGGGKGDCYKYRALEVDCKDYPGKVKPQPMTLGAAVSIKDAVGSEGFGSR
jgi:hypothetical protein